MEKLRILSGLDQLFALLVLAKKKYFYVFNRLTVILFGILLA